MIPRLCLGKMVLHGREHPFSLRHRQPDHPRSVFGHCGATADLMNADGPIRPEQLQHNPPLLSELPVPASGPPNTPRFGILVGIYSDSTAIAPDAGRRYIRRMPIYVFEDMISPRVIALANERGAADFLPRLGPWRQADGHGADGVTGLPEFLRTAIEERGYVLLNVGRDVTFPAPATILPFTRRTGDD